MNNFLGGGGDSDSALKNGTEDLFVNSLKINNLTENLPIKTDSNKSIYSTLLSISDVENLQDALDNPIGCVLLNEPTTQIMQGDIQIPVGEASVVIGSGLYTLQGDVSTLTSNVADKVSKTETALQTLAGDINLPSSIGNVSVGAELGVLIPQANGHTAQITALQNKTTLISDSGNDSFLHITANSASLRVLPRGFPFMHPNPDYSYLYGGLTTTGYNESPEYPLIGWGAFESGGDLNSTPIKYFCRNLTMIELEQRTSPFIKLYEDVICNKTLTAGSLTVDNININGNTISSLDALGSIILDPQGGGTESQVQIKGKCKITDGSQSEFYMTLYPQDAKPSGQFTNAGITMSGFSNIEYPWLIWTTSTGGGPILGQTRLYDKDTEVALFSDTLVSINPNLKLNANILDSNNNTAYILKKGSGLDSYSMGLTTTTGSGAQNLVIGKNSGNALSSLTETILIGNDVSVLSGSGFGNVCIGKGAGGKLNGSGNVFIGRGCAANNISAWNTIIGYQAGSSSNDAARNCLFGESSGASLIDGDFNSLFGNQTNCIANGNNQIALGYNAITTAANQCVIGNTSLAQVLSDGFKDLDVKSVTGFIAIGKNTATRVEIGRQGLNTEIKSNLIVPTINLLTPVGGVFSQVVTKLNTGATTEQTLISSGIGSLTVPANTFRQGDAYCLKIGGLKSNANNDTVEIRLKSGATVLGTTGAIVLPALTNSPYDMEINFTIRQIGVLIIGTVYSTGFFSYTDAGAYRGANFTGTNTINTTIDNTLNVVSVQSNATNNITCESLILTKIY